MRMKTIFLAILLATWLVPLHSAEAQGGLRYTVMVTKFDNDVPHLTGQWDLGDSWRSIMTGALGENENFVVIGEKDMRKEAMAEQAFGASGATVQGAKTPQRGNMTPAQLLVKGVITHYERSNSGGGGGLNLGKVKLGGGKEKTVVRATVYLIDSATAMVLASKNFEGTSEKRDWKLGFAQKGQSGEFGKFDNGSNSKALIDAIDQTIDWIVGRLPSIPWQGEIVLVKDNRVVVNRGSREGVQPGETFVAGKTNVLRDPETGEVLDYDIDRQARLQVDQVREKVAYCKVIDGDIGLLYEGMGIARIGT